MRYLAEELERISIMFSEIGLLSDVTSAYDKFMIHPITLRESDMSVNVTTGHRDSNEFLVRHDLRPNDRGAIPCAVIEYHIPFDGDGSLFDYTTSPMPFYPYGRIEGDCFIISVKDGERSYLSDYDHQLALLRENVLRTEVCVECFNDHLRSVIDAYRTSVKGQ